MRRKLRHIFAHAFKKGVLFFACTSLIAVEVKADGLWEMSLGFSYSRKNYSPSDYESTRRWGATLGYMFLNRSEIELAYQNVIDRRFIKDYEDTVSYDQVYSVNWVQNIFGRESSVQPYFKVGVGQINRRNTGTYSNGYVPPREIDVVTVVLGTGLRIFITRSLALRGEATSYLTGGDIKTWQDNVSTTVGASLYF